MAFTLDKVVPWGRSFEEYVRMFNLTEDDLGRSILGCGDGPASFNSRMSKRGCSVVSVDPLYRLGAEQIENRIAETYDEIMEQLLPNKEDYVWDVIKSPEELGRIRMAVMREFLEDYEKGKKEGRYLAESLPSLPFDDNQFDLAVCSHFLFLYTGQLSLDFHRESVAEMVRTAKEVRIFPLLDLGGTPSPYAGAIASEFKDRDYRVAIETVPYEFQRGATEMMKIWRDPETSDRAPQPTR